jgi:putative SOS response-associated peptidase YedK
MCGRFEQSGKRRYYARFLGIDLDSEKGLAEDEPVPSYNIAPGLRPWVIMLREGKPEMSA